ncbi:hypothetical protein PG993_013988 [Apiospora rasikravindrae]|uniref:rRNA-processing protein FCF1 n=1 Tax=Apiospora rasikravindrae TaxID=990691 RepID=A0ABR1RS62_9PEZI
MGVAKKTRKFAAVKRVIGKQDARRRENAAKGEQKNPRTPSRKPRPSSSARCPRCPRPCSSRPTPPSCPLIMSLFFVAYHPAQAASLLESMMDVLLAKANPIISDCVMGELERLGPKYRLALRIARDPRWERLTCDHKGIYADDCIVNTVMKHRIYIIATNDKDLKNRVRRIPGVPILSVARGKYVIEKLPEVTH